MVRLGVGGAHDGDGSATVASPIQLVSTHEFRDLVERTNRCGESDALEFARQTHDTIDRGNKMCAPLGSVDGVDLIENGCLDTGQQHTARLRAQYEIQALGSSDEYLRWVSQHSAAIFGRSVAATRKDFDRGEGRTRAGEHGS